MKIISSAIKFQIIGSDYWHIMCGLRHADIFETMFNHKIKYDKNTAVQGFLTDTNQFVDRKEAVKIAWSALQISDPSIQILYSEDIWEEN